MSTSLGASIAEFVPWVPIVAFGAKTFEMMYLSRSISEGEQHILMFFPRPAVMVMWPTTAMQSA